MTNNKTIITTILETVTETKAFIKCASISVIDHNADWEAEIRHDQWRDELGQVYTRYNLVLNHDKDELQKWYGELDLLVDVYLYEEITGTIWLSDGSWITREEDDLGGHWQHHRLPIIPDELLKSPYLTMQKLFSLYIISHDQGEMMATTIKQRFPLDAHCIEPTDRGLQLSLFFPNDLQATADDLAKFLDANFTDYQLPDPLMFYEG